jgi:hypothetical protein
MAVTATPIFSQAVRHAVATISTANTNRDGSGTIGTIFTADATDGSIVDHVDITAIGTTTAGVVRLYVHNGSAAFLWKEILVTAITPSTSIAVWSHTVDCSQRGNALPLPAGSSLRASTHNAESFNVHAFGSDL